jgi:hypothetical protein
MPFPLIPFLAGAVVGALATHLLKGSRPGRDAETGYSPGETRSGEPEGVSAAEKESPGEASKGALRRDEP